MDNVLNLSLFWIEVWQCPDVVLVESPNTNWTNERSTAVEKHSIPTPEKIIQFNESAIQGHLSEMVRHSVEGGGPQNLDSVLSSGSSR